MKEKNQNYSTPQTFEGRLPLKQAIPLGLQHILAMFVGNLTPLIIIMGVCGLSGDQTLSTGILQNAMTLAGVVTLIQLYSIGPVGGKVPIVMGTSSGFIGVFTSVAKTAIAGGEAGAIAYSMIITASFLGGLFEGVLGFCIKPLRKFFPSVVTGTVVLAIGLSLIGVGVNYYCGGSGVKDFASLENLAVATVVLIVIVICKHFGRGMISSSSILIGIIAGYIMCAIMTLVLPTTGTTVVDGQTVEYTKAWVVNWQKVSDASWFAFPSLVGFGALKELKPVFRAEAIIPIMIMFIVTAVETLGDISGVTEGGLDREATDKELSGGVVCDGLGSSLAAAFGVLPNTSFSQNVGLVAMTKIINRFAISIGAIFLILCGLCPKVAAVVSIMPQSVLGGAAVMMFASIVMSGVQLITKNKVGQREITIVSIALGLGYGLGATSNTLVNLPQAIQLIFGGSGIVPAAVVAIILNVILPRNEEELVNEIEEFVGGKVRKDKK